MINNMPDTASAQCVPLEKSIMNLELARAYVPFQKLCSTFTPMSALVRGTAFPALYNVYSWRPDRKAGEDDD